MRPPWLVAAMVAVLSGCGTWSSAQKGTAIGVGLGGAAGAAATGSTLGTVGGAALGGVIGHEVGEGQDDKRQPLYPAP